MIRCDPSQSELIRPGLAVRVDPVQLLYPPNVRHGWISCISYVWFLLYEAFSPSLCTVFSKIGRGSLLNEFEQTLYDSIIEIFWDVFLMLNTCALHFKLDYCKGVRQGCILSPMLFNLYLDEIPFLLDQGDIDPTVLPNGSHLSYLLCADHGFSFDLSVGWRTRKCSLHPLRVLWTLAVIGESKEN